MARQDFINAEELVNRLNEAFNKHKVIIENNAEALKKLQVEYSKLPSDYLKAQKEIQQSSLAQGKTEHQLLKVKQQSEKVKQDELRTTQAQLRLDKQKATYKEQEIKRIEKERQKLEAANSIYNKVQQKLNLLTKEYRDLAVQKELTGRLTDAEAKKYDFLSKKINKYDQVLKGVDASMGKYQRNVGNYASAFNPLQNSINQLTREMPAFAYSVQTGFMALSNNIPIFFDSMKQIIAQNKELRAQGQETVSVIRQLGSSFLSWGTALSVAVTLFTVFGEEITDAIFNTKEKEEADKKAKEAIEAKNDAEKKYLDTIKNAASEEISRAKLLFENARNVNLSMKERREAIDELRTRYPKYLKNLTDQKILAGQTAKVESQLNDALIKRATALAIQDKIREAYARLTQEIVNQNVEQNKQKTITQDVAEQFDKQRKSIKDNADGVRQLNEMQRRMAGMEVVFSEARERGSKKEQERINAEIQELLKLYNQYSQYLDIVEEGGEKHKEAKEKEYYGETNSKAAFERTISVITDKLSLISKENQAYGFLETQLKLVTAAYEAMYGEVEEGEKNIKYGTVDYYNDLISRLREEQSALANTSREYSLYQLAIDQAQVSLDELTGKKKDVKELNDELQKFFKGFTSDFLSEAGLSSLETFFDGTFKNLMKNAETTKEKFAVTFLAITEVAQQAFAFINQNQQAQSDAQYARLDKEKELALRYGSETEEGRAEIERQFEERRRQVRMQEAKAQKEQALFNIAINTAQGITAALASVPPNPALAVAIGVIGAAQAAIVASRQIPQYAEGTDNHTGGLMVINDAPGSNYREVVQTPDGKVYKPQERNVIAHAPKGTKVFKNYKSFEGELNKHLQDTGIAPLSGVLMRNQLPDNVNFTQNGGISKEEMKAVMKETLGKTPKINMSFDNRGFKQWVQTEAGSVQSLNNYKHGKGFQI